MVRLVLVMVRLVRTTPSNIMSTPVARPDRASQAVEAKTAHPACRRIF
jgi:hypothetical protein